MTLQLVCKKRLSNLVLEINQSVLKRENEKNKDMQDEITSDIVYLPVIHSKIFTQIYYFEEKVNGSTLLSSINSLCSIVTRHGNLKHSQSSVS